MTVIRHVLSRILFSGFAALVGAFFALPMLWLTLAPFNARGTLAVEIPRPFTLANFQAVFANAFAVRALGNSLILAGGTMLVVTLTATLAAYALSRAEVPYYDLLTYGLILFSSVVTGTAAMVPIFLLANALGLVDTYVGVIMAFTGGLLPTAIFILRDFVEGLPRSYEESAMVCGASPWRMVWDVVMPLLRPGMMVVGIWAFVQVWGAFLIPFVLLRSPARMPAAIAIYSFYTEAGTPILTLTSAYALLYALPVLALYLFVNARYGFRFFGGIKR
ncbi:MAG: carbohydrate ABC transporter permease [Thermoflexus sp.]|jgi:multiple sugar transport system permease protein|uniref:carbohydrate ABC transporter permease n=1 Tax=Thermoflexus TaxID=1495649 RepID=UPI001C792F7B|nr:MULTISPECIES: carbohydrate ABC transporter permease [Thermoflexus]MDT7883363.1 carbohydrate ABC transporter permease [Thermoflexus sp.]MDT7946815.1 carbohydrate ABC transporter permease [Thermoflexus sp.]QWK10558.1 MAG: carbohydrate ABC transporter permease [Thermoflexus hugenholtzii]